MIEFLEKTNHLPILSKRLILSILIAVGIIFVLLLQISLKDLYSLLRTVDPFWVAAGSIAYLLAIFFRALRFKWLIDSKVISLSDLFRITVFYHLSLMVLPSKLGEFSLPYLLNKISGTNVTQGLASLIVSRVYDLSIVLIVLVSVSAGFQGLFKVNPLLLIFLICFLVGFIALGLFYISSFLNSFSRVLGRVADRTRSRNAKFIPWVQKKMEETAREFYAMRTRRIYFPVSLTSLASWIMIFWTLYAYMKSFGIDLPLTKMLFGSTISVLANALPVSGIGNWGTLEAGWAAGFLMVGLSKEKAIASGFGVHIITFVVCAFISFFCWLTLRKQKNPSPAAS